MSSTLENEYVHTAYSRLATYQMKDHRQFSPRIWPNVRKFLESQTPGSTVIDVGCGEAKYTRSSVFVLGVDTCADALIGRALRSPPNHLDLLLADALKLPFRDNTADAILNVSVLHHLSTASRRKAALEECGRCLRPGGQMLTYVWAYEQPNGSFKSQDLLVPWNLSEIPINVTVPTRLPVNRYNAIFFVDCLSFLLDLVLFCNDPSYLISSQSIQMGVCQVVRPRVRAENCAAKFVANLDDSGAFHWSPNLK
ncbi:unnamed protein product [Haemonchus placei]|uniref:Methyltransf_11 domain-containing protein n=1 Tax=Haemonchus placei TaxID=6290 RepID=A0A0N4X277_HAEPC|nr:unnamed protein product [Haemonchus placei]